MFLIFVFFYIINLSYVFLFNFDVDFPIVYTDPNNSTTNRANYFGYSVILYNGPNINYSWIQIGAPRANNSLIKILEPGVIFRCSIFGPCKRIDVDINTSAGSMYRNAFRDKKDKAWIGGTMDIDEQLNRVVVCGYRWVNNRIQDYWMLGACYWSHVNDSVSEKLLPLFDNSNGIIFDKIAKINVFYYAQGQAGFAAHFSKSQNTSELLLGAPGVYNWDGTTLRYTDGPDSAPVASKLQAESLHLTKRTATFFEFSDLNIANAIGTTQTASFGLFGYSVTSGYFFDKNELLYVTGAPRAKSLVGQILIYTFANISDQALEVKDSRQGYQYGEYFGSALSSGDINEDGLDDLIVGAPFYTNKGYNEGRIYVYLGSEKRSLETPNQNSIIEGKAIGGQFGSCIIYLGDIHRDGYAEIAVGAPYENEGSGVVYIYKGNEQGLLSEPCQRLVGKKFVPNIQGFGISMSKATDIDENYYSDIGIGAYLSGHVVLLRAKPIVVLQQSVISLTPRLEHNAKEFQIKACFWYKGHQVPATINVSRRIIVDELLLRAYLSDAIKSEINIILNKDNIFCQNATIFIKSDLINRNDPITVSVSQELVTKKQTPQTIFVGPNEQTDSFCKTCAISNPYKSHKEHILELPFVLGCGEDNICTTKLNLVSKFLNISDDNRYVLGSTSYLKLEVTVSNTGEKAYLTQLVVNLPSSVYFRSIPTSCLELNSTSSIICNIDNPLYENKHKSIIFDLDMKDVNTAKYGNTLTFTLVVLTSSEYANKNVFTNVLNIAREADILLTGKNSQQSYSYGDIHSGQSNFTQIYQVEKIGASTIDKVFLTIKIPTHIIYKTEPIRIVQLYPPEGIHGGQPINCQSNIHYKLEDIVSQFGSNKVKDLRDETNYIEMVTDNPYASRTYRQVNQEDLAMLNEIVDPEYPDNRTFHVNCSNNDVICSTVTCFIGPFKVKQNIALIQLRMLMNITSLSALLNKKDIIVFSTDGMITIKSPPNFIQTGSGPDFLRLPSIFIGKTPEAKIETWIIIVSVIAGLLLLLLLVMGLIKAGFFQRAKKKRIGSIKRSRGG